MTAIDELRTGIRALLKSHPLLTEIPDGYVRGSTTKKVDRYAIGASNGIGHEFTPTTKQNLWVLRSSVDVKRLDDIEHVQKKEYAAGEKPGRNSNLEQIPGFRRSELICFFPKTLTEAERIIAEVLR